MEFKKIIKPISTTLVVLGLSWYLSWKAFVDKENRTVEENTALSISILQECITLVGNKNIKPEKYFYTNYGSIIKKDWAIEDLAYRRYSFSESRGVRGWCIFATLPKLEANSLIKKLYAESFSERPYNYSFEVSFYDWNDDGIFNGNINFKIMKENKSYKKSLEEAHRELHFLAEELHNLMFANKILE